MILNPVLIVCYVNRTPKSDLTMYTLGWNCFLSNFGALATLYLKMVIVIHESSLFPRFCSGALSPSELTVELFTCTHVLNGGNLLHVRSTGNMWQSLCFLKNSCYDLVEWGCSLTSSYLEQFQFRLLWLAPGWLCLSGVALVHVFVV